MTLTIESDIYLMTRIDPPVAPKNQRIRMGNVHTLFPQVADFSRWPPKPKRIAESSLSA
jgi:hypothetical protein